MIPFMAFQLIYTSAARLLDAGRSGFGTVARSRGIPPLAASAIERFSQFANQRDTDRSRIILAHRRVTAGSNRFHVLSRIRDAGSDYTGRTNHIAHHLVFTLEEVARAEAAGLTPTDIMRQMPWLDGWNEPARYFETSEDVSLQPFPALAHQSGRQAWTALTGQPCHARLLAWDGAPRNGLLVVPENAPALALLGEALAETGRHAWSRTFTTSLEGTDDTADFDWILATPTTFPALQNRCGSRPVIDATNPSSLPLPPEVIAPAPAANQTEPAARQSVPLPDIASRAHGTTFATPTLAKATRSSVALGSQATLARKSSGSQHKALFAVITASVVAIAVAAIYLVVISPMQEKRRLQAVAAKNLEESAKAELEALRSYGLSPQQIDDVKDSVVVDKAKTVEALRIGYRYFVYGEQQLPKKPVDGSELKWLVQYNKDLEAFLNVSKNIDAKKMWFDSSQVTTLKENFHAAANLFTSHDPSLKNNSDKVFATMVENALLAALHEPLIGDRGNSAAIHEIMKIAGIPKESKLGRENPEPEKTAAAAGGVSSAPKGSVAAAGNPKEGEVRKEEKNKPKEAAKVPLKESHLEYTGGNELFIVEKAEKDQAIDGVDSKLLKYLKDNISVVSPVDGTNSPTYSWGDGSTKIGDKKSLRDLFKAANEGPEDGFNFNGTDLKKLTDAAVGYLRVQYTNPQGVELTLRVFINSWPHIAEDRFKLLQGSHDGEKLTVHIKEKGAEEFKTFLENAKGIDGKQLIIKIKDAEYILAVDQEGLSFKVDPPEDANVINEGINEVQKANVNLEQLHKELEVRKIKDKKEREAMIERDKVREEELLHKLANELVTDLRNNAAAVSLLDKKIAGRYKWKETNPLESKILTEDIKAVASQTHSPLNDPLDLFLGKATLTSKWKSGAAGPSLDVTFTK